MVTITISGTPGSGKSTVAQLLHERLKIKYIYSGMLFRQSAEEHNMSLEEFGKYCEENPEVDKELDEKQIEILKKGDIILEGRLAGWLSYKNNIPAFKIAIKTDIKTRAERIVKREGGEVNQREKEIIERERSENTRYKKYYDIDLKDFSVYDLVIDSSNKTPEEIVNIIIEKINL
jgi:predicted cytidylate kinase